MRIRRLLLVVFLPLCLIPTAVAGLIGLTGLGAIRSETDRISSNIHQLGAATTHSIEEIEVGVAENLQADYAYLADQMSRGLDERFRNLVRITETAAASPIIESFLHTPNARLELADRQLSPFFQENIDNHGLAEISLMTPTGRELLRRAADFVPPGGNPVFDREPLPNRKDDESTSPWFFQRSPESLDRLTVTAHFSDDFPVPEPVLSLLMPLKYKAGHYSPIYGDTEGYLRLVVTIRKFLEPLIPSDPGFDGRFILTDDQGAILAHPDPSRIGQPLQNHQDHTQDYYDIPRRLLGGRMTLIVLASKARVRDATLPPRRLAEAVAAWTDQTGRLSRDVYQRLRDTGQYLLISTLLTLAVLTGIVLTVARRISRPIGRLSVLARTIANGQLEAEPRIEEGAGLEIVQLANDLDVMRRALKDQIHNLDRKVADRTRKLDEAKKTAEAANRAKSEFLANISHEIRTPLNAIIGTGDLLAESGLDETRRGYLNIMRHSGEHLLSLINGVLDLAKIESGQLELDHKAFDLVDEVEKAVQAFTLLAEEKELDLGIRFAPGLPSIAWGDPMRLRQILVNLIGNAVKFTDKGLVVIEVRPDPEGQDSRRIWFQVRDTGIGIPPEKHHLVFERFTQADSSTTRQYGGSGLGLTISQRLVQLMNGRIWLDSSSGKGSVFHFVVSLKPDETARPLGGRWECDLEGVQVMMKEPRPWLRDGLMETFQAWGAAVALAGNGPGPVSFPEAGSGLEGPAARLAVLGSGTQDRNQGPFQPWVPEGAAVLWIKGPRDPWPPAGDNGSQRSQILSLPILRRNLIQRLETALGRRPEEAPGGTDGAGLLPAPHIRPVRVLLAEDNRSNRLIVDLFLKDTPFVLQTVENGLAAVEGHQAAPFDILLMDMQMPVMDGLEVVSAIRRWEAQTGRTRAPIVALTAHSIKEDLDECLRMGCDEFLVKPIHKDTLMAVLRKYAPEPDHSLAFPKPTGPEPAPEPAPPDLPQVRVALFLKDLMPSFFEDSWSDLETMRQALKTRDMETLRRLGHNAKGAARGYGFMELGEMGRLIEEAARDGNSGEIGRRLDAMAWFLENVQVEYI